LYFDTTLWVCWEFIILINTKEKPFYAIQIKNHKLAQNLKNLFIFIWWFWQWL
jgi:hypothetical protein